MDLKLYLSDYSRDADNFIKTYFADKRKRAAKIDPLAVKVLTTLENFLYGGKKVRGALTVLGYRMAGGKNVKDILPVSIALEIMHSSLLIHDDFIDHDDFRRGKPTVHRIYAKGQSEHFGASIAVIIGDVGIFLSNQILADSSFDSDLITNAFNKYEELLINTGYGEILDIVFDKKKNITWNDILKVRKYKTAHYTFVMPLTVGAVLAAAEEKTLINIKKYGEPVGIGFQIRDDILGIYGDPDVTGKSNESDIKEGKKTFLLIKALDMADKENKAYLGKWYGSAELKTKETNKIREIIKNCGAYDYSQKLALDLATEGKKYVSQITIRKEYQNILNDFADFVVTRDK